MTAHAERRPVGGWRALLAILPWLRQAGGRHAAGHRVEVPVHEGATDEYGDELAAMNRARKAAKSRTFRRGAPPRPELRTEYVSTDATARTEAELHHKQLGPLVVEPPEPVEQPRRRRLAGEPLTGEFTQCPGCRHLGCLGDCRQLTAARARADFVTQVRLGVNRGRLTPPTVHTAQDGPPQ